MHEERTMLKNQISAQQKVVDESHPDEARLAEMEAKVDELLKVYEAARENSREIREGVSKLNKQIKDIQSHKVEVWQNLFWLLFDVLLSIFVLKAINKFSKNIYCLIRNIVK